jgi:hypothetical protein
LDSRSGHVCQRGRIWRWSAGWWWREGCIGRSGHVGLRSRVGRRDAGRWWREGSIGRSGHVGLRCRVGRWAAGWWWREGSVGRSGHVGLRSWVGRRDAGWRSRKRSICCWQHQCCKDRCSFVAGIPHPVWIAQTLILICAHPIARTDSTLAVSRTGWYS